MVQTNIYINLVSNMEIKKRRATDFIWSKITDRSDQTIELLGNHVFYCLQNGHGRVFIREELKHIPEDTQVLPDRVSKWK